MVASEVAGLKVEWHRSGRTAVAQRHSVSWGGLWSIYKRNRSWDGFSGPFLKLTSNTKFIEPNHHCAKK